VEFIATARKWRPLRFDEIVGQEHITATLKNAVLLNRLHHAFLFSGPRGVGKTTTARILARVVNCKNSIDAEPCNQCDSCRAILEGHSLDVIEIDGASNNSVDDIRTLRENAKYPPSLGKYKLYIIDEIHMLSTSAFNALLKILEEPPKHLIFIFATTEPHKVLPTIMSRCQRFEFRRMEIETIKNQIHKIAENEGIQIDELSLFTIAKKADGSMRDAQSIFDQFVASSGKVIAYEKIKDVLHLIDTEYFFRVSDAILNHDLPVAFQISQELTLNGYDYFEFISGLAEHFRNIFTLKVTKNEKLLSVPSTIIHQYIESSEKFKEQDLLRMLNLITQTEQQLKFASQPKIRLELLLAQLIEMPSVIEISELIAKIDELKTTAYKKTATSPTTVPKQVTSHPSPQPAQQKKSENYTSEPEPSKSIVPDTNLEQKTWEDFLEKNKKTLNGLQSLSKSEFVKIEFRGTQIVIIISNQFAYENINNKRRQLRSAVKEYFGNHYDVEIIFSETSEEKSMSPMPEQSSNSTQKAKVSSKDDSEKTTQQNERTELEKTLIELFNAREIPLP
jgi:DNA polymerase-3 subunit gamma/tau